jgi:AcrR family transcriptional regulator
MVMTPWGASDSLRERKLEAGHGVTREDARQNQRERLFGAMVACCETAGYEATSVADLLRVSGVSRGTFYEHFDDKLSCFEATTRRIVGDVMVAVTHLLEGEGDAGSRGRAALSGFVDLIVAQPAAARLCFVYAYAAGERGVAPVEETVDAFVALGRRIFDEIPGREGLPEDLARAIIGGFYRVVYERLQGGRERELTGLVPGLWDWAMSYEAPPEALTPPARRRIAPGGGPPAFARVDPEQRIIRAFAAAVARKGYEATTIADVAAAGRVSQSTFYEYFADKDDVMAAALDSSGAQMLGATLPAARRAPDWAHAVRLAAGASLGFLAAEADFALLRIIAAYAAGPKAIAQRDASGTEMLQGIIGPVFDELPEVQPLQLEAMIGAINGILYTQVRAEGPDGLPAVAPLVTYVSLAPYLGAQRACQIANGDGRGR